MIVVEGLTKDYGARRAIDSLSFEVKKGEVVGFLGPNGAGKTTTMRILAGFIPPTSGTARVAGFDVLNKSLEVRRRVGYLPETVPLYPDMTVVAYLRFMADLRHTKNPDDRIDRVLAQVHMVDRSHSLVGNLSKGMRQRIGLAQALIHQPEVLILDEPTIGLDPAQIVDVRNLIREMGKDRTVLLSTHILSEVQQICDRILIINKGRIVAEDTPEHLEAHLAGAQRVHLEVAGISSAEKILVLLQGIAGVARVTQVNEGGYELESLPGQDPRPAVSRAIMESGMDLLEIRAIGMSLEEIFMQLTSEEPEKETPKLRRKFRDRVGKSSRQPRDPIEDKRNA